MSYDSPEFDTAGEFEKAKALINVSFPGAAAHAGGGDAAAAARARRGEPLQRSAADAETLEWMTPGVIDAIERAAAALAEARDELESILDDMGTIEPGTPFAPVDGPQRGMVP
jgi:hypothetical protein